MKKLKNDPNRNRKKDLNLSGLYAVTNDFAYKNGKLRDGVYGVVSKDTPYVCRPTNSQKGKSRTFKVTCGS